jgi:hypothetical protein
LISNERCCFCFAGAIAAPTVRDAGVPFTAGAFAAAVPDGTVFWFSCFEEDSFALD